MPRWSDGKAKQEVLLPFHHRRDTLSSRVMALSRPLYSANPQTFNIRCFGPKVRADTSPVCPGPADAASQTGWVSVHNQTMRAEGPRKSPAPKRVGNPRGPTARVGMMCPLNPARERTYSPCADRAGIGSDLRPEHQKASHPTRQPTPHLPKLGNPNIPASESRKTACFHPRNEIKSHGRNRS